MLGIAIALAVSALVGMDAPGCGAAQALTTGCPEIVNTGDSVVVTGEHIEAGSDDDRASESRGGRVPVPTMPIEPTNPRPCDAPGGLCERPALPGESIEDAGLPAVTLADLESFRPVTPALTGEPAGFGVVGMPTNFVAAASEQAIPGVLLGYPVTVRFTPTAFVFSYGDGTSARSATGGATWAQVGAAQFSPTDTTHVYRERGVYSASVAVEFAASVDFGTGWIPVDGVVTASSGAYPVEVVEVHTALVDRTCEEDPTGPGCG